MEQKIPFTSYDFWAYLSAGFLLLGAIDEVTGARLLQRASWSVVQTVIATSAAYATGQIVASFSSWIWERWIVGRLLGFPRDVLLGHARLPHRLRFLLSAYFQPLPSATCKAILAKANAAGTPIHGEALFQVAFARVRTMPSVTARLDNFLNLYGFSRNIAAVAFLCSCMFYWSYLRPDAPASHLNWAIACVGLCLGMTLRYLKFYRLFASEVLTSFAFCTIGETQP